MFLDTYSSCLMRTHCERMALGRNDASQHNFFSSQFPLIALITAIIPWHGGIPSTRPLAIDHDRWRISTTADNSVQLDELFCYDCHASVNKLRWRIILVLDILCLNHCHASANT